MSPNRNYVRSLSLVLIVLINILPIYEFALCELGVERTRSEIELAEESFSSTYLLVLEAERAGGDVSELIVRLNNALEHLSGAKRSFESGEYDKAVLLAGESFEVSNLVADDAVTLKGVAEHRGKIMFRNLLLLSLGTVFFTVLLGFLGWRRFKEYYLRRMMGFRPEVIVNES